MLDSKPTTKVTSTSIVWFLLTLCVVVIMGMTAAWASGIERRAVNNEVRLNTLEQQFSTVVVQLQDLRESQRRMDGKIDKLLEK